MSVSPFRIERRGLDRPGCLSPNHGARSSSTRLPQSSLIGLPGQASLLVAWTLQLLTEYLHDLGSSLATAACRGNSLRTLCCGSR